MLLGGMPTKERPKSKQTSIQKTTGKRKTAYCTVQSLIEKAIQQNLLNQNIIEHAISH